MTSPDRDYDDVLRRAFHAMADPIEPTGDGLVRIRTRLDAPWLRRQLWLLLTECIDLVVVIFVRSEPLAEKVRAGLLAGLGEARASLATAVRAARYGLDTVAAAARGWLARPRLAQEGGVSDYFPEPGRAVPRRRTASHRFGRGSYGRRPGMGSTLAWVRPALAITSVVVVVAAGAFGLTRLRQTIINATYNTGHSAPRAANGKGPGTGYDYGHGNQVAPGGGPSQSGSQATTGNKTASGGSSAAPTPCSSSSPGPISTPSPSPSPSASPSPSPSPSPSASPSPSPSATPTGATQTTPSTSAPSAAAARTDAIFEPCISSGPTPSTGPSSTSAGAYRSAGPQTAGKLRNAGS
jgi:hypothetical protein